MCDMFALRCPTVGPWSLECKSLDNGELPGKTRELLSTHQPGWVMYPTVFRFSFGPNVEYSSVKVKTSPLKAVATAGFGSLYVHFIAGLISWHISTEKLNWTLASAAAFCGFILITKEPDTCTKQNRSSAAFIRSLMQACSWICVWSCGLM